MNFEQWWKSVFANNGADSKYKSTAKAAWNVQQETIADQERQIDYLKRWIVRLTNHPRERIHQKIIASVRKEKT